MANTDKNIVITPNRGQASDPQIVFSGANASLGPQNITLKVYPTNSGTVSFEGSAGQLFSLTNTLTGTIYSVNDVSGIPSIEVLDTGLVKIGQYSGRVLIGTGTDNGTDKVQVNGNLNVNGALGGDYYTSVISTNTTATRYYVYIMTSALTLTLPASPGVGDWVGVANRSGSTSCVIARNGSNIMSLAEDMTVDVLNASFKLVYADATRGWTIL